MSGEAKLEGRLGQVAPLCLAEICTILESHSIRYALDGGTLLGIARENRLLPWDNDLDFFIPASDAAKVRRLRYQFLKRGYWMKEAKALDSCGPIPQGAPRIFKVRTIRRYNGYRLQADLIIKYISGGYYYWSVGGLQAVMKRIPTHFYDKLDTIEFRGRSYPIPSQTDEYLRCRYGDWRAEKREWNFRLDDRAKIDTNIGADRA